MRTYLECIACFVRQSLEASQFVTDDTEIHERVMRDVLRELQGMDFSMSSPEMAQIIQRLIRSHTGIADPYATVKKQSNEIALGLYPRLEKIVNESKNPFVDVLRLAIAGNIIDFGVNHNIDLNLVEETIESALHAPMPETAIGELQKEIERAKTILYLADNAGEIVFDRLLIERLPLERLTVAVRGAPVLNDATMPDAWVAGLPDIVEVIDNGSDAPGTFLADCSEDFLQRFENADLILAKGQGNYETLSDVEHNIFFLLKIKCAVVARNTGLATGSFALIHSNQAGAQAAEEAHASAAL